MNIDKVLEARGNVHGPAELQFELAQHLKQIIRAANPALPLTCQETLDMLAVKIARIVVGDPMFDDHWLDIEGYARRMRQIIEDNRSKGVNRA